MLKFQKLKHLKIILGLAIIINYTLWCLFFIFQGKAIDLAIIKTEAYQQLIYTLAGFILIKMLVMLCDLFQKYISEHYKCSEIKSLWNQHMPQTIYKDYSNYKNDIGVLFFEYMPRLYDYEVMVSRNNAAIATVFPLTIFAFIYTKFYWGILAFFLVFVLNYVSKNIFTKQIDQYQKESDHSKVTTLKWIEQYFSAYREISKNWPGINKSHWNHSIYQNYADARHKQTRFYLYRDLLSQMLVELPFLLNASVVIMGVYYGHLSITQLFVWLGFSQFMINTSNFYLENKVAQHQSRSLTEKINAILSTIQARNSRTVPSEQIEKDIVAELKLRDGTKNILSLTPGIYHIKGGNGAGKSTLLNIILDYDHDFDYFENSHLEELMSTFNQSHIRVIERDVILFECIDDINAQICGPVNGLYTRWEVVVGDAMKYLLTASLSNAWMNIFMSLLAEYHSRKNNSLSSGEKVMLSILRFFASWNTDVNLLIIDECDSFLDTRTKSLFIETLDSLSGHMAVYICSHDMTGLETINCRLNQAPHPSRP